MGDRVEALEEALAFLFARTTDGYKFGLDTTFALLEALGNPHERYPVIHVAGTNGKGSSLATAEALLLSRGLKVGKYTSPHLVDFRERVLVSRVPMNAGFVVDFLKEWTPYVEQIRASFFEATTAMAFRYFADQQVDVALIETGLGGRLDSTNVVNPASAGVTSIGWDHMEYLGDTLELIAGEKAGIFKKGRPAVIGHCDADITEVLRERALEVEAVPLVVEEEVLVEDVEVNARGTTATVEMLGERERLTTPLIGRHQAQNLAFTLALLHAAGPRYAFSLAQAKAPLGEVALPGRFHRAGPFIFDVAHNADGARVLAETLQSVPATRPMVGVFCALKDKDWREMITILGGVLDSLILTNAPTAPKSRSWDVDVAGEFARDGGIPVTVEPDFDAALKRARQAATVVVTGSFHTVGDAMARLQVSPFAT